MSEYLSTNYKEYVKSYSQAGILKEEDIYYLTENVLDNDLQLNFNFVIWDLNELEKEQLIEKTIYYFDKGDIINAYADRSSSPYKIYIYKRLFNELEFNYFQKEYFTDSFFLRFEIIKTLIDVDIQRAMFQGLCFFIYNHELGHIKQFSKFSKIVQDIPLVMNENYSAISGHTGYNEVRHLMEIDADYFATERVANQIYSIWERLEKEYKTNENLELMISSNLASIFIFFLVLAKGLQKSFYSKEFEHPHPLIRITYIASYFVTFFNKFIPEKLDETRIISNSLNILNLIKKKQGISADYTDSLQKKQPEIEKYLSDMLPKLNSINVK